MINEVKTFEERKEALIKLGLEKGYVTYEQLANELKGLDIDADALEIKIPHDFLEFVNIEI